MRVVGKAPGYGFVLWLGPVLAGVAPYALKKTPPAPFDTLTLVAVAACAQPRPLHTTAAMRSLIMTCSALASFWGAARRAEEPQRGVLGTLQAIWPHNAARGACSVQQSGGN